MVRGDAVELTPTEWGILTTLARVPGRVYSRYELINQVRGYEFEGYERTVNSHIKNLRHKVELEDGKPRLLKMPVLGGGYRLGLLRDPLRKMAPWGRGRLASRLVLAFVGVAMAAEAASASVTLLTSRSDLGALRIDPASGPDHSDRVRTRHAYRAADGWPGADFRPRSPGRSGRFRSGRDGPRRGRLLTAGTPELFQNPLATMASRHLTAHGQEIGTIDLAFPHGGLTPAERKLRGDLVTAVAVSAVIAAAVALLVAVFVAKGLVRPIRRLSEAARALGSGTSGTRVGKQSGPGELVELAGAFDSMATSIERHEDLSPGDGGRHRSRAPHPGVAILQAETEALVDGVSVPTPEALVSLHDESLRLGRMVQDLQTLASADAAASASSVPMSTWPVAARAADSLEGRFSWPASGWSATCPPPSCGLTPAGCGRSWPTSWPTQPSSHRREARSVWSSIVTCAAPASRWPTPGRAYLTTNERGFFERFFRGSLGRTTGGSGIGLAVVKDLVEAHGGEVQLENPPVGGSRFVVFIPLAPTPPLERTFQPQQGRARPGFEAGNVSG